MNEKDIVYVDFLLGGCANQSINPLNEFLCDNIIVFTPIKNHNLSNLKDKYVEDVDFRNFPKKILGKTTAINKFVINQIGRSKNKRQFKPTRNKNSANEKYINQTTE